VGGSHSNDFSLSSSYRAFIHDISPGMVNPHDGYEVRVFVVCLTRPGP
jgi:hypothetical protein